MPTFKKLVWCVLFFCALLIAALVHVGTASAVPLQTWSDWVTAYPSAARAVTPAALMVRGMNENAYYVLEVDPTTGEIPVTANVSINAEGTPGSPPPSVALYVAGTDGTNLQGLKTDSSGELQVDVLSSALPTGAATAANQTTANTSLSSIDGKTPSLGQATSAASVPVVIASDQSGVLVEPGNTANTTPWLFTISQGGNAATVTADNALKVDASAALQPVWDAGGSLTVDGTVSIAGDVSVTQSGSWSVNADGSAVTVDSGLIQVSNLPTIVDTNTGAAGSSTPRVVLATRHEAAATPLSVRLSNGTSFGTPSPTGRAYADSVRNDYSSTNVTTGAWVQLIASTAAAINGITIFDSCGQTLELGTGAAASESRVMIIPPGGIDGFVPLAIASGTRVSVRAVSATCSSGELDITGFN
jgi:hypothetical protein